MAFTFDSTVKSATGNSYVSIAQADDYFAGHLKKNLWEGKDNSEKQIFLVSATTRLDMEQWAGRKTDPNQRLQWPRRYIESRDVENVLYLRERLVFTGDDGLTYYLNEDTIPLEIQQATFELAIWYAMKTNTDEDPLLMDEYNLEVLTEFNLAGKLSGKVKSGITVDRLPTNVKRLLSAMSPNGWLAGRTTTLIRG